MNIFSSSNRWWNDDLTEQLGKLREARRGRRRKKDYLSYKGVEKFKRWKWVAENMSRMIGAKKEKCC